MSGMSTFGRQFPPTFIHKPTSGIVPKSAKMDISLEWIDIGGRRVSSVSSGNKSQ
jgi:hypothetical protein